MLQLVISTNLLHPNRLKEHFIVVPELTLNVLKKSPDRTHRPYFYSYRKQRPRSRNVPKISLIVNLPHQYDIHSCRPNPIFTTFDKTQVSGA